MGIGSGNNHGVYGAVNMARHHVATTSARGASPRKHLLGERNWRSRCGTTGNVQPEGGDRVDDEVAISSLEALVVAEITEGLLELSVSSIFAVIAVS